MKSKPFMTLFLIVFFSCSKQSPFESSSSHNNPLIQVPSCIIGGHSTEDTACLNLFKRQAQDFESVVALVNNPQQKYFCSGVLIHPSMVLTAAHCLDQRGPKKRFIKETAIYLGPGVEGGKLTGQYKIEDFFIHPLYQKDVLKLNDLAVLVLKEPITHIPAAPIMDDVENLFSLANTPPQHQHLFIAGYGKRDITQPQLQGRKFFTDAHLLGFNSGELFLGHHFDQEKDSCSGDSGGPVFYSHPPTNKLHLLAVTSRGPHHCRSSVKNPSYYATFFPFICLIEKKFPQFSLRLSPAWEKTRAHVCAPVSQDSFSQKNPVLYFTQQVLDQWSQLSKEKELNLARHYLQNLDFLLSVHHKKKIIKLSLQDNYFLTDVKILQQLPALQEVNLSFNPHLKVEDLYDLRRMRPDLKIIFEPASFPNLITLNKIPLLKFIIEETHLSAEELSLILDATNELQQTALSLSIKNNNWPLTDYLLRKGANPRLRVNKFLQRPLLHDLAFSSYSLLEKILAYDPTLKEEILYTPPRSSNFMQLLIMNYLFDEDYLIKFINLLSSHPDDLFQQLKGSLKEAIRFRELPVLELLCSTILQHNFHHPYFLQEDIKEALTFAQQENWPEGEKVLLKKCFID